MENKLILYYIVLIISVGCAIGLLVRASKNLCRGNPHRRDHNDSPDSQA